MRILMNAVNFPAILWSKVEKPRFCNANNLAFQNGKKNKDKNFILMVPLENYLHKAISVRI